MKKFFTMILAVIMCVSVFAFTGCGKIVPTEEDNGGSLEGVEFDAQAGEMYEGTKEGKTAIKINYATGFKDGWIRQAARSFLMDEEGKDYYFVLKSDSEITTSMASKLESGVNLSDIYMPLASNWQSYASQGQLENLDDLYNTKVPGEEKTILEKINGSWKTYGIATRSQEEHYFVFPWNENIAGFVYNKTMFDQYGWEVPATVDELDALCAQIVTDTKGKVAPFVYPGSIAGGYWDFIGTNWWLQYSGIDKLNEFMQFESAEVFNPDLKSSPSYGKQEMLETFEELIVKNKKKYTLSGSTSKDHLRAQISFASGEAAMIPNGNWIERESSDVITDEIRMMRVPYVSGAKKDDAGNYINYNYGGQPDFICIPAEAKNKAGAKKFLAFMCKDEMLIQYTELTGAPRPFDYDVDKCESTEFGKSCLEIWKTSTTWFESSNNPRWTSNKIKKFQTNNPYNTLLSQSDTVSASGWCANEYDLVKKAWDTTLK